jgi:hypothetical protein
MRERAMNSTKVLYQMDTALAKLRLHVLLAVPLPAGVKYGAVIRWLTWAIVAFLRVHVHGSGALGQAALM